MRAVGLRILSGAFYGLEVHTRMPFRYGIATMTCLPHVFLRLEAEVDGQVCTGLAADHLPPKWFTKDPAQPFAAEVAQMQQVLFQALRTAVGLSGPSAFALWQQLDAAQRAWGAAQGLPPLLVQFGVSMVERALLDAVCRARKQPLWALLRLGALGLDLGAVHPELAGLSPAELLPARPLAQLTLRHTVGLADPLADAEIAPTARCQDGLPQSLLACIARYGLRHFKIKVSGDPDADLERLERLAALLEAHAPPDYAFSLDGNEQFASVEAFRAFWERLQARPRLRPWLSRLLFVEQPLHRDVALAPAVAEAFRAWPQRPPVIIDESDATCDSLPTALRLGYAGTSHKNCKGVCKSIANACLLAWRRRRQPAPPLLLSGEDLTTIGPVSLLQDLAVCALLGIASVERNGHHYFAGLSMMPPPVQAQVLAAHPDLYQRSAQGWPTLRLEAGRLAVSSVNAAPFGYGFDLDVTGFSPLASA
ncbi:MAG: mandelate racemase [Candidatus Tectimicrobiota bacterium]|nr:MAG: mandelate racemase [Candidatus Tectomicrobia bacterium]